MGKLFEELKRRKVFRVAAVYAVVAWVLIQVSDVVLPTFEAPAWVNQTLIFLFILGFPLALILAWAYEVTPEGVRTDTGDQSPQQTTNSIDRKLIYATFVLVLLAVGFQTVDRFLLSGQQSLIQPTASSAQNSSVMRFTLPVSQESELYFGGADAVSGRPASTSLALSNDGKMLVYAAHELGSPRTSSRLYRRRLEQDQAEPMDGTEGAASPFFSPDNAWIGFYVRGTMQRIPVGGGIVQTIIAGREGGFFNLFGASWGDDDTIIYGDLAPETSRSNRQVALYRVAASGGVVELLADPASSEGQFTIYSQPHLLPGSKSLLFQGSGGTFGPELAEIIALDLDSGAQTSLLSNAMNPRYVPETGHLLFMRQGTLMAVGFDPAQLLIQGEPVIVLDDVMHSLNMTNNNLSSGAGQLSISRAGHLAYVRGGVHPDRKTVFVRVTIDGEAETLDSDFQSTVTAMGLRLSPGGDQLAFVDASGDGARLYVHDFIRNVTQQLNSGAYRSFFANWSPDGKSIAFNSTLEDGVGNIYRMAVDGSDEQPQRLAPSDQTQTMASWSSSDVIAYHQDGDIWILPPGGEPAPFFTSDARELYATFSPDGRWIAYISTDQIRGSGELYIRPYPGPGPAILIDSNFNSSPGWSRNGDQLYFVRDEQNPQRRVMSLVDIEDGVPSPSRSLIDPWPYQETALGRNYDVLEDGSFITTTLPEQLGDGISESLSLAERYSVDELQVVLNFFELLRERVGE